MDLAWNLIHQQDKAWHQANNIANRIALQMYERMMETPISKQNQCKLYFLRKLNFFLWIFEPAKTNRKFKTLIEYLVIWHSITIQCRNASICYLSLIISERGNGQVGKWVVVRKKQMFCQWWWLVSAVWVSDADHRGQKPDVRMFLFSFVSNESLGSWLPFRSTDLLSSIKHIFQVNGKLRYEWSSFFYWRIAQNVSPRMKESFSMVFITQILTVILT